MTSSVPYVPGVPVVQSSQPGRLGDAADQTQASLQELQRQLEQAKNSVTQLRGGWEGSASDAAHASAQQVFARQERVISALQRMQTTLSEGGSQLSATRSTVMAGVSKLEQVGYQVADDGTVSVSPGSRLEQLATMSPTAAMQIQSAAATGTAQLKSMLADFGSQDAALSQALQRLSDELESDYDRNNPSVDEKAPADPGRDAPDGDTGDAGGSSGGVDDIAEGADGVLTEPDHSVPSDPGTGPAENPTGGTDGIEPVPDDGVGNPGDDGSGDGDSGGTSDEDLSMALGGDPFADDNDDVFEVPVDPGGAASGGSVIGPIPDELI